MKNILAVDYGKKRIGLAWLQPGINVVLPYGLIRANTKTEQLKELQELVSTERITDVVFGLPLDQSGAEGENAEAVRTFAAQLTDANVHFIDERHSSKLADHMEGDATRDEKAAMAILQTFVEREGV